MAADGQIVFEISADGRKATAAINDITEALKKAGNKWESDAGKTTENVGNKFTDMFKKIGVAAMAMKAGKALLDFGKDAIQAASDLEEVQNVVDVTFGDGTRQIEAWAKTAGDQFGLTETQAKRFTSTLGAMMKSAGMAGPEIVGMSTDLAGLAADMASFYNLDFDTAFQKIRSGISGETEPLKQLGINMSVVNLEAFALTQGITKAFNEMSQGEQTMLRYQYLMQATADAQGDFARTSDGLANTQRRLDTAIDTLKTKMGEPLLGVIADATGALADFIGVLVPDEKQKTVLDDLNDIEIEKEQKLADIQAVANKANDLLSALKTLNSPSSVNADSDVIGFMGGFAEKLSAIDAAAQNAGTIKSNLTEIASGANELGVLSGTKWSSFVNAISGLTGKTDVPATLSGVADALGKNVGGKSEQWEALLTAVGDNLGTVTAAVIADKGQTAAFLEAAAAAADDLGGDYSTLWGDLLIALGTNAGAAVTALSGATDTGTNLASIASGANGLTDGKAAVWSALLDTLTKVDGLENIFDSSAAGNVSALAQALSDNSPDTSQAEAWATFLGALQTNPEALTTLTKTSADETAGWLKTMAEAANEIEPADAQAWSQLLGSFVEGLPGLNDTEYGSDFFDALRTNFLAMGSQSDVAAMGLQALGYSTEDINDMQQEWLITCQRLVREMPGLNSIINAQTGEIEGGTQAVADYIEEWKAAQEQAAFLEAVTKRRQALEDRYADRYEKQANLALKAAEFERRTKEYNELAEKVRNGEVEKTMDLAAYMLNERTFLTAAPEAIAALEADYQAYMAEYERALQIAEQEEEIVRQRYGADAAAKAKAAAATEELTENMSTLAKAAKGDAKALKEVEDALNTFSGAMDALATYQEKIREETASTLKQTIRGFEEVVSPATRARNEVESLTAAISKESDAEKKAALERKLEAAKSTANAAPSFQTMQAALDSQLKFMREYNAELAAARASGVSAEILAQFSDGSAESFDYLYALNHSLEGLTDDEKRQKIEQLNETYRQVQETAEGFTNELTNQKLAADQDFQDLVQDVQNAAQGLDMGDQVYQMMHQTLQSIIDACNDQAGPIATAIGNVRAQWTRLANLGFGAKMDDNTKAISYRNAAAFSYSHANGIDYVPYDGYLALLHQGERIQTAAEADLARRYSYQQPGFDYSTAGAAIGANIPRGNVYLDGRIVGDVIGSRQANSYRALERSGWQG